MAKFLDEGNILDCGKIAFLTAEKIILKTKANVEMIKTNILSLEQKLSSLVFLVVHKINTIFSRRLNDKYKTFNA